MITKTYWKDNYFKMDFRYKKKTSTYASNIFSTTIVTINFFQNPSLCSPEVNTSPRVVTRTQPINTGVANLQHFLLKFGFYEALQNIERIE